MIEHQFMWSPIMTGIVSSIPGEIDRYRLMMAIIEYGTYGTEPSLDCNLNAIFVVLKKDIDSSREEYSYGG